MDAGSTAHYIVRTHMNLLLLLSALLSALTGVNAGGGHAPVAAEQVARATRVAGSAATAVAAVPVPVQVVDLIAARSSATPVVRFSVLSPPLYASRRRE